MQRHRFYALPSQLSDSKIRLDAEESHHLSRVLRLNPGDRAFVFDGEGREYECEIESANKGSATLSIVRELNTPVESPLQLTLAQALIKSDKFDWVVQKATELGVTRIVPLLTEHCEVKFRKGRDEERTEQKLARWRRISMEALKQSGRRRQVEIADPTSLINFAESETEANNLFFAERDGESAQAALGKIHLARPFNLIVGPEGGWSEDENKKAEEYGFVSVTLGSRILRAETAAIAALTLTQHLFGDLR